MSESEYKIVYEPFDVSKLKYYNDPSSDEETVDDQEENEPQDQDEEEKVEVVVDDKEKLQSLMTWFEKKQRKAKIIDNRNKWRAKKREGVESSEDEEKESEKANKLFLNKGLNEINDKFVINGIYSTWYKKIQNANLELISRDDGPETGEEPDKVFHEEKSLQETEISIRIPLKTFESKLTEEDSEEKEEEFNILHSFGSDSLKRNNIEVINSNVIVSINGNRLHFQVDLSRKVEDKQKMMQIEHSLWKAKGTMGISAFAIHPNETFIAVGIYGIRPSVCFHSWPDLKENVILKTNKANSIYSYMCFNNSGDLLLSQTRDFELIVWKWEIEEIVFKAEGNSSIVYKACFSSIETDIFITGGENSLQIWKFRNKRKEETSLIQGKFGLWKATSISAFCIIESGHIITGTSWGNLYIWKGSEIIGEIGCNLRNCHFGEITDISLVKSEKNEIITSGSDGFVRIWKIGKIMNSIFENSKENSVSFVMFEQELRIRESPCMMNIRQSPNELIPYHFYIKDGKGGIWKTDLTDEFKVIYEKVIDLPTGKINSIDVHPDFTIFAIGSEFGHLQIYDFVTHKLLAKHDYAHEITHVKWIPFKLENKENVSLIASFSNGVIRMLTFYKIPNYELMKDYPDFKVFTFYKGKPFDGKISLMKIHEKSKTLLTFGENREIFIFDFKIDKLTKYFQLIPKLRTKLPFKVMYILQKEENEILVVSLHGEFAKCNISNLTKANVEENFSYFVEDIFKNVGMLIPNPNKKIFKINEIQTLNENHFIFAQNEKLGQMIYLLYNHSMNLKQIFDFDEENISNFIFSSCAISPDKNWMICGSENGQISIIVRNKTTSTSNPYDFSNLWANFIHLHDHDSGYINQVAWNSTGEIMFSIGNDGGIYTLNRSNEMTSTPSYIPHQLNQPAIPEISDFEMDYEKTLDELIQKPDQNLQIFEKIEDEKIEMRRQLTRMKMAYEALKFRNDQLPQSFQLSKDEIELSSEIRKKFRENHKKNLENVQRILEFESQVSITRFEKIQKHYFNEIETRHFIVKDISHTIQVSSFRLRKLSQLFHDLLVENKHVILKELGIFSPRSRSKSVPAPVVIPPVQRLYAKDVIGDYFEKDLDLRTAQAIRKLEIKLEKKYIRECKWSEINASKPKECEDEEDQAIQFAESNKGDFVLKSSEDFYDHKKITVANIRKNILDLKRKIHKKSREFNNKLYKLKEEKPKILEKCNGIKNKLLKVQELLPQIYRKILPQIYEIDETEEPENFFKIEIEQIGQRQKKKCIAAGLKTNVTFTPYCDYTSNLPFENSKTELIHEISIRAHLSILSSKTFLLTEKREMRMKQTLAERLNEQKRLLSMLNKIISNFKTKVEDARTERLEKAIDLKLMEIKYFALIEELNIYKEMEEIENQTKWKYWTQKMKFSSMKKTLSQQIKRKLNSEREFEALKKELKKVQLNAEEFIQTRPPIITDQLYNLFKRRKHSFIDLNLKIQSENEDSKSELSSDDEDISISSHDSNSELLHLPEIPNQSEEVGLNENEGNSSTSQPSFQLSIADKEKVQEYRNEILELEKKVKSKKKELTENLRKLQVVQDDHDLLKLEVEKTLITRENLKREKQKKVIKIQTTILIKAHQLKCFDYVDEDIQFENMNPTENIKSFIPGDVEALVLMDKHDLSKLESRVSDLKFEITFLRDDLRLNKKLEQSKRKELEILNKKGKEAEKQAEKDSLEKFGKIVDIEEMAMGIINLEVMDALLSYHEKRKSCFKERKQIETQIETLKKKLVDSTKKNTDQNLILIKIKDKQLHLNKIARRNSKIFEEEDVGPLRRRKRSVMSESEMFKEINYLKDLLSKQQDRIESLREAVSSCKHKSGLPQLLTFSGESGDGSSQVSTKDSSLLGMSREPPDEKKNRLTLNQFKLSSMITNQFRDDATGEN